VEDIKIIKSITPFLISMRLKSELYKKEQDEIIDKIITILV